MRIEIVGFDGRDELAPSCEWVASVCTGAMLLAAAGLTKDRPATTHHNAYDALQASGATSSRAPAWSTIAT